MLRTKIVLLNFIIISLILFVFTPALAQAHPPCSCKNDSNVIKLTAPPINSKEIRGIQLRLAQLGFYFGPINETYDKATYQAVLNFQRSRQINPTGQLGTDTWLELTRTSVKETSYDKGVEPPPGSNLKVVIDTEKLVLSIMVDGKCFRQYPIAIGKFSSPSPVGEWKIINKAYESGGALGTRWMGLNVPWGNYGIHGTNRPWSIGWAASGGCFRMFNEDVETIYPWLPVGTPVVVKGPYTIPNNTLKPGRGSPEVVALQAKLREKGFYLFGPTDGDYGLMTELAVKNFQIFNRLKVTGIADISTLNALEFNIK
ncbi:MAG: hypothetical protein PWP31_594 [Clostridia bacterium]|nr:hypothetical protein [Clostridia bacterium]